ncbi:MAG: histidinol-phosphatase [Planctomycetota bacterium]
MAHLRGNLHTHTWRCKHARGDVVDYLRAAQTAGLSVLGMSDHTPTPDGRWNTVRMDGDQLDGYCEACAAARSMVPEVSLHVGFECEPVSDFESFYREELLGRAGAEYLVCGTHWVDAPDGTWPVIFRELDSSALRHRYAETLCRAIESGLYLFIAHPDAFGGSCETWDAESEAVARAICSTAARAGVPLELNSYGLRKPPLETAYGIRHAYPWPPFWAVAAECGARVVRSSDAHRPEDVAAGGEALAALIAAYDLDEVDPADLIAGVDSRV